MISNVTARLCRWWDRRPESPLEILETWARSTRLAAWLLLSFALRFAAAAADCVLALIPCALFGILCVLEFRSLYLIQQVIRQRAARADRADDRGLQ